MRETTWNCQSSGLSNLQQFFIVTLYFNAALVYILQVVHPYDNYFILKTTIGNKVSWLC